MKNSLKNIKETLLTTLFALWLLIFYFNIIIITKEIEKITIKDLLIDLWKIPLSFVFPVFPMYIALYYLLDLPLVIVFSGLVSALINRLAKKHAFTLSLKNRSKRFNFFFNYSIKGLVAISITILTYYSNREYNDFISKNNIDIPQILEIIGDFTQTYLVWLFFASIYIFFFYFLADWVISYYKKKKLMKC